MPVEPGRLKWTLSTLATMDRSPRRAVRGCLAVAVSGVAALAIAGLPIASALRPQAASATGESLGNRAVVTPIYGLTIDDIGNVGEVIDALKRLPQRPTVRIYFDTHEPASYYTRAVTAMHHVSYLMGELLDSSDEIGISTAAYGTRVRSYLSALASRIDLWEIGNEVNGNRLGSYLDVEAKLVTAYTEVSQAHKRTALTLYYNLGCGDGPAELDPLTFSRRFVPARIRDGLDLVLLSYYEQNCRGIRPSASAWRSYYVRLHALYPHARLGFGEIGLTQPVDASTLSYAEGMIRYYYSLAIRLPYYVGGYFWWYCAEDCIPYNTKPLFPVLRRAFAGESAALRGRR
jgi:hypothetical protein